MYFQKEPAENLVYCKAILEEYWKKNENAKIETPGKTRSSSSKKDTVSNQSPKKQIS